MWRSLVARSRPSLLTKTAAAAHSLHPSTQNPKVLLPSKTLTLIPHFPIKSPPPRFYSQLFETLSDSESTEPLPSSDAAPETQIDDFAPGDEQLVGSAEIDEEKLEGLLSLLSVGADVGLESRFRDLDLTLDEDFVVRVVETLGIVGESLVRFLKWGLKEKLFIKL